MTATNAMFIRTRIAAHMPIEAIDWIDRNARNHRPADATALIISSGRSVAHRTMRISALASGENMVRSRARAVPAHRRELSAIEANRRSPALTDLRADH